MPDGDGDGGLADAAGADHGHEAMERQAVRDLLDDLLASDHLRKLAPGGSGGGAIFGGGRRRPGGSCLSERGDEAIAAAGHVDDITGRLAGIAERLAQSCDVESADCPRRR